MHVNGYNILDLNVESEKPEYGAAKQKVGCYVLWIDVIKISHKKKC